MAADRPRAGTVTAVVPHYGDPEPTLELVRTLQGRPGEALAHIVVSDDCSPQPFPEQLPAGSVPTTVVRRTQNGGFGANVNSGLDAVHTPLALVLNSDVDITGADIDALVAASAPYQPAVTSPQVVNLDGSPQYSGRHFPTVLHQTVEWLTPLARFRHRRALHELVGHDMRAVEAESPVSVDWVMGAVMLLPVAHVRGIGGLDESYFMNSEEVDLQLRLRRQGIPSLVIPSIRVAHVGGASSDPLRRRAWLVDSRYRYAQKWGHPRALKAALTAATGVNFAVNSVRQRLGTDVDARQVFHDEMSLVRGGRR